MALNDNDDIGNAVLPQQRVVEEAGAAAELSTPGEGVLADMADASPYAR